MNYERGVWPEALKDVPQWVSWRVIEGRKQPHSLFADTENKYSWSNPSNWGTFAEARSTARKTPYMKGVGFILQKQDDPYREPADDFVLIDFDDVRDPETGAMHPDAAQYIETAGTYGDVSTSGTGAHLIGRGELPEGVRTIQDDLHKREGFDTAEIEVYDGKRFTAMTGRHIETTPKDVADISELVAELADEFDTNETTESRDYDIPQLDNGQFEGVELTDDIDDLNDAIESVTPRDIRLRSNVTNERSSGVIDYDPSYRQSDSGVGLAWFNEKGVWCDRDGLHYMDALKLVAVEEGIISGPGASYPSGEDYWKAVERLRERGANIPRYSGSDLDRKMAFKSGKDTKEWFQGASAF